MRMKHKNLTTSVDKFSIKCLSLSLPVSLDNSTRQQGVLLNVQHLLYQQTFEKRRYSAASSWVLSLMKIIEIFYLGLVKCYRYS